MNMDSKLNFFSLNLLFSNNKIINKDIFDQKNTILFPENIHTLLVVSTPTLSEEEQNQIEKIMAACKRSPEEYTIIYPESSWLNYRNQASVQEVILFGVSEIKLGIAVFFPENQSCAFDGKIWIKTRSIAELMTDQQAKNTLWQQALKPHFIQNPV